MKELKQPTMSSVPVCLKRVFQATSLAAKIRIKEQSHSVIVVLLLCNQVRDREPDALFWKCPSLCCYCCEETLWLKQPGKERVFFLFCFVFLFFFFFGLYVHITLHHQRKSGQELKQGRNLEAGVDADATEECCLLACSPWLAGPDFL
jgi:hypothetical protein